MNVGQSPSWSPRGWQPVDCPGVFRDLGLDAHPQQTLLWVAWKMPGHQSLDRFWAGEGYVSARMPSL